MYPLDELKSLDVRPAQAQTSLILSIPNYLLSRQGKSFDYALIYSVDIGVERFEKNVGILRKVTSFRSWKTPWFIWWLYDTTNAIFDDKRNQQSSNVGRKLDIFSEFIMWYRICYMDEINCITPLIVLLKNKRSLYQN